MASKGTSIYLADETRKKLKIAPYGLRGISPAVTLVADRYAYLIDSTKKELEDKFPEFFTDVFAILRNQAVCFVLPTKTALSVLYTALKEENAELAERVDSMSVAQKIALIELYEEQEMNI